MGFDFCPIGVLAHTLTLTLSPPVMESSPPPALIDRLHLVRRGLPVCADGARRVSEVESRLDAV